MIVDNKIPHGYYTVADKTYISKISAYAAALPNNWLPHWNYHEAEFDRVNWKEEPSETLDNLYRQRSFEIRLKYDYIFLSYSGGVDSHNIAVSFFKNGLHIDLLASRSSSESYLDSTNNDPKNMGKESLLAALPQSEKLKQYSNNVNFKIINWGADIVKAWDGDRIGTSRIEDQASMQASSIVKRRIHEFLPSVEKYNNPVMLCGIDKPYIYHIDGKFYLAFMDLPLLTQMMNEISLDANNPFTLLPYYWHPDSEKILRKQAHIVIKWFRQNPQFMSLLNFPHRNAQNIPPKERISAYDEIVNRLIYTCYDPTVWQTKKNNGQAFIEEEHWWHNNPDMPAVQRWFKVMKEHSNVVYDMFTKADKTQHISQDTKPGFWKMPGCYSKMYAIS
jgi:hypothetical protein